MSKKISLKAKRFRDIFIFIRPDNMLMEQQAGKYILALSFGLIFLCGMALANPVPTDYVRPSPIIPNFLIFPLFLLSVLVIVSVITVLVIQYLFSYRDIPTKRVVIAGLMCIVIEFFGTILAIVISLPGVSRWITGICLIIAILIAAAGIRQLLKVPFWKAGVCAFTVALATGLLFLFFMSL
jgi:hypothetical protein